MWYRIYVVSWFVIGIYFTVDNSDIFSFWCRTRFFVCVSAVCWTRGFTGQLHFAKLKVTESDGCVFQANSCIYER